VILCNAIRVRDYEQRTVEPMSTIDVYLFVDAQPYDNEPNVATQTSNHECK
jgi:hypothetical protein